MPEIMPVRACTRSYAVDDMHVREDGSGRVVEAYAAVFKQRAEIFDQDGHYNEENTPDSFDRTIQLRQQPGKPSGFQVLFNHGADISGRASGHLTIPIGVPVDVKTDENGVYTVTRYIDNPLADNVLKAIKGGAIRAQSYTGRFRKSVRTWPDGRGNRSLPLITRQEVDMREYGPTVFPAYEGAMILGTRAADLFIESLLAQDPEKRLEWLQHFEGLEGLGTPYGDSPTTSFGTPESGLAGSNQRSAAIRERIRSWKIGRGETE